MTYSNSTTDSDSVNLGSNPSPPANQKVHIQRAFLKLRGRHPQHAATLQREAAMRVFVTTDGES